MYYYKYQKYKNKYLKLKGGAHITFYTFDNKYTFSYSLDDIQIMMKFKILFKKDSLMDCPIVIIDQDKIEIYKLNERNLEENSASHNIYNKIRNVPFGKKVYYISENRSENYIDPIAISDDVFEKYKDYDLLIENIIQETHLTKQYNSTNKLNIYHIGSSIADKLNILHMGEFIEYEFIAVTDITDYILKKILDLSMYVIIFICIYNKKTIEMINRNIKSVNSLKKNIKIINLIPQSEVTDMDILSMALYENYNFYKIINVLSVDIKFDSEKFSIIKSPNARYLIDKCTFIKCKINQNKYMLIHWLIPLINTPKYLINRISQISETCWLSTILNSLLLVNDIRDAIRLVCEEYCDDTYNCNLEYTDFRDSKKNSDTRKLMFSLLKNYFNGIKLCFNEDYLLVLASHIKDSDIPTIISDDISRLNLSDEKKYKLCRASTDNKLRQEYCTSREKNAAKIEELNKLCSYYNKSICSDYHNNSDEYNGYIYGSYEFVYAIKTVCSIIFGDKMTNTDDDNFSYITVNNLKMILDFKGARELDEQYKHFKLCSSCIIVNDSHVICGLVTDSEPYKYLVYDSGENVWAYDDWSTLNYTSSTILEEFRRELYKRNISYTDDYFKSYLGYRLYIDTT
jgi:hypothetical protein